MQLCKVVQSEEKLHLNVSLMYVTLLPQQKRCIIATVCICA